MISIDKLVHATEYNTYSLSKEKEKFIRSRLIDLTPPQKKQKEKKTKTKAKLNNGDTSYGCTRSEAQPYSVRVEI